MLKRSYDHRSSWSTRSDEVDQEEMGNAMQRGRVSFNGRHLVDLKLTRKRNNYKIESLELKLLGRLFNVCLW